MKGQCGVDNNACPFLCTFILCVDRLWSSGDSALSLANNIQFLIWTSSPVTLLQRLRFKDTIFQATFPPQLMKVQNSPHHSLSECKIILEVLALPQVKTPILPNLLEYRPLPAHLRKQLRVDQVRMRMSLNLSEWFKAYASTALIWLDVLWNEKISARSIVHIDSNRLNLYFFLFLV